MNKKKLLALVLAALMSVSTTVVAFADESTPAATQNAGITVLSENKTLSTNLSDFGTIKAGGDYQEFTVTTGGEDDLSTYVFGKFLINGAEPVFGEGAPYSIQYYETQSPWEGCHDLESNYFGPTETGFPFKTGLTSKFQVKFNEPGTYKIEIQLVKKDAPSEVIVTTGETEVKVTPENITPVKDESGLKDALAEGGYVMLSQNITLTNPIEIGVAGTTLDLGGYSLVIGDEKSSAASTLAAHDSWVAVTAPDVTITNGTIDARKSQDKYVVCAEQGGSVILNGVAVNSDSAVSGAVANYGTMTIESANVTGGRFAVVAGSTSTTVVNGGEFSNSTDKGVVYGGAGATIALNRGSFTNSSSKTAVELENGGRLTVKEGASITVSGDAEASDVFKFNGTGSLTMDEGFKAGDFTASEIQGSMKDDVKVDVVDPSEEEENDRERSGGDYFGNAKWAEVKAQIAAAEEGDTIEMSGTGLPWFPSSVARALKGKDVTLEIRKNGVTYTLNGQKIGPITKIWYNFDENLETTLQPVEE